MFDNLQGMTIVDSFVYMHICVFLPVTQTHITESQN